MRTKSLRGMNWRELLESTLFSGCNNKKSLDAVVDDDDDEESQKCLFDEEVLVLRTVSNKESDFHRTFSIRMRSERTRFVFFS